MLGLLGICDISRGILANHRAMSVSDCDDSQLFYYYYIRHSKSSSTFSARLSWEFVMVESCSQLDNSLRKIGKGCGPPQLGRPRPQIRRRSDPSAYAVNCDAAGSLDSWISYPTSIYTKKVGLVLPRVSCATAQCNLKTTIDRDFHAGN
jgi:hypothetical protein